MHRAKKIGLSIWETERKCHSVSCAERERERERDEEEHKLFSSRRGCPPRVRREKGVLLINFHGHKGGSKTWNEASRDPRKGTKGKGGETKIKWMEGGGENESRTTRDTPLSIKDCLPTAG